jgi:hypothetical protein
MKYIREGRMGPPKVFKTGAVVSTYPKPMLVLEGDEGGLDVLQNTPINWLKDKAAIEQASKLTTGLPAISTYNFVLPDGALLNEAYKVAGNQASFSNFVNIVNILGRNCPWKTIVVDPITNLSDIIYSHLASADSAQMGDPRKWAFSVGAKIRQVIAAICTIKAHAVFIIHSTTEKNELTGIIIEEPMIYSKYRDKIGADLSQFFYATIEQGKPMVWTQPQGFVRGIGCRWPANLPAKVGARFEDIYGESVKKGEMCI